MRPKTSRGFTYIELLTTMAVTGVIASVTIPSLRQMSCRSQRVEGYTVLKQIHKAEINYHINMGEFTCNGANLTNYVDLPWEGEAPDIDPENPPDPVDTDGDGEPDAIEIPSGRFSGGGGVGFATGGSYIGKYFRFNFANPIDCTETEYWAAAKRVIGGTVGGNGIPVDTMKIQYFGHNDSRNGIVNSVQAGCESL